MVFDRAVAEIELRGDLGIRQPLGRQACDLRFLGCELVPRLDRALADGLAGGQEFAAGAFGESVRAHRLERGVRGLQLGARVDPAMLTPEPFAVVELRPGVEDDRPGPAQLVDRLEVKRFRFDPIAQQRAHRGLDAPCPFLRARARPLGQAREGDLRREPVAAPYRCLDQLGQHPAAEAEHVEVVGSLCRGRSVRVLAESVVQHRGSPLGDLDGNCLSARRPAWMAGARSLYVASRSPRQAASRTETETVNVLRVAAAIVSRSRIICSAMPNSPRKSCGAAM